MVLNITVKTLDSQNYQFDANDDWTVHQFKEHIESTVNVSSNEQRLIFCGRVLQDDKKLTEYDCSGKVIHLVRRPPPTLDNTNQESSNADSNDNNNNYRDAPPDNNRFLDQSNVLLSAMTLGTEANMNPIVRHFLTIQQAIYSRFRADGTASATISIEPLSMTDIDRHLHNAARLLRITVTTVNECMARIASLPSNGTRQDPESESMINRRVISTASSHTDLQRDDEMQASHANLADQSANVPEETVDDIAVGASVPSGPRRGLRASTTRQSLTTDDLPSPAIRTIQRLVSVAVTRSRIGSGPPLTPRQRGESELDRYLSILNYSCDLQNQFQGLARRYRQLTDMSRRGGLIVPQTSASTSTTAATEQANQSSTDQPTRQQAQNAQTSSTLMNEARILGMYIPRIMYHIGHLQHALSDFSVDFTRGRLLLCVATNARNRQRSASRANGPAQNSPSNNTNSDAANNNNNNNNGSEPGPPQANRGVPVSQNMDMGLTEVVSNIVGSIFRMPQQSVQQVGSGASNTNQEPLLNIIPELALNATSQILGSMITSGIPTGNQASTPQNQQGGRTQQSTTTSSATVMMDIDIDDSSSSQSESRYQDARDSQSPSTLQSSARSTNNSTQAFIPQPARSQGSSSSNIGTRYNRQQLVEVIQSHPDWIPIIEADIGVMEQQQIANSNSQPFFSDAYLSSIPRKRRRLLASNSNQVLILQPSPSNAIANILRRAISSSSSPNTESLDQILSAISSDQNLQSAYEDYIKTAVEARLKSDYDYCPEKFENSSKYFK